MWLKHSMSNRNKNICSKLASKIAAFVFYNYFSHIFGVCDTIFKIDFGYSINSELCVLYFSNIFVFVRFNIFEVNIIKIQF